MYALLAEVGARVRRPLTVVLERDGRFPPMRDLLWQLDRARAALAEGRARLRAQRRRAKATRMRPEFETFLARLYTDAPLRARFLADPRARGGAHQLTAEECDALERIDRVGLELSARSFAHKRALKEGARRWWDAFRLRRRSRKP